MNFKKASILRVCCSVLFFLNLNANASTFILPIEGDIVGKIRYGYPEFGETLNDVALRYDIGANEIQRANPHVAPNQILSTSTRLIIPSQFILPAVPRSGIVINLAEFRLYYFPPNENVVHTFPVGIGRVGWNTPVGETKIISKQKNPEWHPTENVRIEAEKNGFPLPEHFPAGPYNPLGTRIFRLGWPSFLIHGSNKGAGIGERISAGCIRMLTSDIEYLYDFVNAGTKVRVINEPIKIGLEKGALYMQMYRPLDKNTDLNQHLNALLDKYQLQNLKFNAHIKSEMRAPSGIVIKVS